MQDNNNLVKLLLQETYQNNATKRVGTYIHASQITRSDFCARQKHLINHHNVKVTEAIGSALTATFETGKVLQDITTNTWLKEHVWGHWVCGRCGFTWNYTFRPTHCANCPPNQAKLRKKFEYREVMMRSHKLRMVGSVDFFIQPPASPLLYLVEHKIMSPTMFKDLKAPLSEHAKRTRLYLAMTDLIPDHLLPAPLAENGIVLYISRGHGTYNPIASTIGTANDSYSPWRQFRVKRDDKQLKPMIEIAQVYAATNHKTCPRVCASIKEGIDRGCPVAKHCFDGD